MRTKWLNKISKYLFICIIGLMALIYYSSAMDWTLYTPSPCESGYPYYDTIQWSGPKEMDVCPGEFGLAGCYGCCLKVIYYDKILLSYPQIHTDSIEHDTIINRIPIINIVGIFYQPGCNCNKCTNTDSIITTFYNKYFSSFFHNEDSLIFYKSRDSAIGNNHNYNFLGFTTGKCFDNNGFPCDSSTIRCCWVNGNAMYDSLNIFNYITLNFQGGSTVRPPCGNCNTLCNQVVLEKDPGSANSIFNDSCVAPYSSVQKTYYSYQAQKCITVHACVFCHATGNIIDIYISGYENYGDSNNLSTMEAEMSDSLLSDSSILCGFYYCKDGDHLTMNLNKPLCMKTHWDGSNLSSISCSSTDNDWCLSTYIKCWGGSPLRSIITQTVAPHTTGKKSSCDGILPPAIGPGEIYNTSNTTPWTTNCYYVPCP